MCAGISPSVSGFEFHVSGFESEVRSEIICDDMHEPGGLW